MAPHQTVIVILGLTLVEFVYPRGFDLATDFQKLCPDTPLCRVNKQPRAVNSNGNNSSCCSSCSCKARCKISRDCCPDKPVATEINDTDPEIDYRCLPLEDMLASNKDSNRKFSFTAHYLTIQACPTDYLTNHPNSTHIARCYDQSPSLVIDYIPVVDWRTSKIYRNYHCALCHNVTDSIPWTLDSTCLDLYLLNNPPDTIAELRKMMSGCHVRLKPSPQLDRNSQLCRSDAYYNIISSCNKTGAWDLYDGYVFEKCNSESYISFYFMKSATGLENVKENFEMTIYKNPFCFLCNSNESVLQKISCNKGNEHEGLIQKKPEKHISSFKASLNVNSFAYMDTLDSTDTNIPLLKDVQTQKPGTCRLGEVFDPYKKFCRTLYCPIYEFAYSGICMTKLMYVDHLTVSAHLRVHTLGTYYMDLANFSITNELIRSLNSTVNDKIFFRCDVVNSIVTVATNISQRIFDFFVTVMVSTNDFCSVRNLFSILKFIDSDAGSPFKVVQHEFQYDIGITYTEVLKHDSVRLTLVNKSYPKAVNLTRFFYCPRVLLTMEEYNESVELGILEQPKEPQLDRQSALAPGSFEICRADYEKKFLLGLFKTNQSERKASFMTVASAICSLLSMVCLLIVLATFALFKELRFMPGTLFIMLCSNLFIAQGLFEFGMGVGGSGPLCLALGILIHYFWLAVACSMNSCMLLMFNHFHCPLQSSSRSAVLTERHANKQLIKFAVYTYSCPLLFVLTNVTGSLIISKNESIGYGGKLCYINSPQMRGLLFALPLGLIILVNFILFGIVLYDIMKVKSKHFKADSDNICGQVVIFLKYSSITGMYWSLGYLYEVTRVEFLGYIFILLNAGQGVFLMVSFVLNRKVMYLYRGIFGNFCKKMPKRSRFRFDMPVSTGDC